MGFQKILIILIGFNQNWRLLLDVLLKRPIILTILILSIALFFRLYSASSIPLLNDDELNTYKFGQTISFNTVKLNLPIVDKFMQNPLLSSYVLKISVSLFGNSLMGGRMLFILLSTFGLYFIYKLVQLMLNQQVAILSLCLLVFSQFHIGFSRLMDEWAVFLFFAPAALYAYFMWISRSAPGYLYGAAILAGLGCLTYEGMLLWLAPMGLFLLIKGKYRFWLRRKEFYLALALFFLIIFPILIWNWMHGFPKFVDEHVFDLGFSLRSFYLYFGEVLIGLKYVISSLKWDMLEQSYVFYFPNSDAATYIDASYEYPVVHYPLAILIGISLIYGYLSKNKPPLIEFCLFAFCFIFFVTSVIAGSFSMVDDHWWAGVTIFPGVILCAYMLTSLQKTQAVVRPFIVVLLTYFLCHAIYFVQLPESQFALGGKDLYAFYLHKARIYYENDHVQLAKDRCRWILNRTKDQELSQQAQSLLLDIARSQ